MGELRVSKATGQQKVDTAVNSAQGSAQTRFVQVEGAGAGTRYVQIIMQAGEDWCPQPGDRVFLVDSGGRVYGVASSDKITPAVNPGEVERYSYNSSGVKLARHKLKSNGKHLIKNETASADLRTGLDNLFTAIDSFSNATAQAAITSGGTSSVSLAAAIVALQTALNSAASAAKTIVDNVLDNAP